MKKIFTLTILVIVMVSSINANPTFSSNFKKSGEIDLQRGLIAYYPFNSNANDESGNGHHAKIKGAKLVADRFGNLNSAYAFTGKKNSLSIPGLEFKSPYTTVSCWVRTPGKANSIILESNPAKSLKLSIKVVNFKYQFEIIVAGKKYTLSDQTGKFSIDPAHPRSDFIMIYYDGSFNFYINNSFIAKKKIDVKLFNVKFPLKSKKDLNFCLNGVMDDIRLYNRLLDPDEREALYNDRLSSLPVVTTNQVKTIGRDFAIVEITTDTEADQQGVCYSTSPNPGTFNRTEAFLRDEDNNTWLAKVSGLKPNTTYYIKAYAINSAGEGYGNELSFKTLPNIVYGSVKDVENNVYKTVKIGSQVWMAQNLRTTKYNNGDPLPYRGDMSWQEWIELKIGAYGDIYKDSTIYGKLYNYYTVIDSRKLCPSGWHIPTDAEWSILINYAGGGDIAGEKLREIGDIHWQEQYYYATDEYGFSAVGSGFVDQSGATDWINQVAYWWSSTEYDPFSSWMRYMEQYSSWVRRNNFEKNVGLSVRCVEGSSETISNKIIMKLPETNLASKLEFSEIYPNPASNVLYFRNLPEKTHASIYDLRGIKILETDILNSQIDISAIRSGVYLITITDGEHIVKKKLIVE